MVIIEFREVIGVEFEFNVLLTHKISLWIVKLLSITGKVSTDRNCAIWQVLKNNIQ